MIVAFLLMWTFVAHAQDWLVASGFVRHLNGVSGHCNDRVTPGFGVEKSLSADRRLAFGVYDNSNCRVSGYGSYVWLPLHQGSFHLGALAGAVTGYQMPVMPAAGLTGAYEGRSYGLNLIWIPPVRDSGNVLWLQAKFAWR